MPQGGLSAGRWTTEWGRCGEHGAVGSGVGVGYDQITSTVLYVVIGFAALGIIVWLATSAIWMIAKRVGRATHLDEPVDRFFDVDGRLDSADYLKFKEKHPHGGHG